MSSTRSPFQKAPATKGCALIVSHGQPSDPAPAEAALARLACRVGAFLPGWHVDSATLADPGALDKALEASPVAPLVYPMFMTSGWFTGDALSERLSGRAERVLSPFGTDPGLVELATELLGQVLNDKGWTAPDTRLLIAGHGSGRSDNSSRDTVAFADRLARLLSFAEMRIGYVEEPPYIADMAFDLGEKSITLPFFAARGGHVLDDIPEALDLASYQGVRLDPIGLAAGVPKLIARAIATASRAEAAA